jgi:hypothetical protein
MKNFIYTILAVTMMFLSSCEKVIELKLDDESSKLVIEANMSNMLGQQVIKLSRNIPFSQTNNYPAVSGAQVSITDEHGTVYNFTEGTAGTYIINSSRGVPGTNYTMRVSLDGKTYTAVSKMPNPVILESISSKKNEFDNKNKQDIIVNYKDPKGIANQYRFVMYVNDIQVKQIMVNNDNFTDGNMISQELRQQDIDIYPGDRVKVEMQCIDKPIYTYWSTLRSQDGGVTPSNPPTNISPLTLGYFSAFTTSSRSIVVQ